MPRRFVMTVCLLGGLFCLSAHAQPIPTKINVTGERQLHIGQRTVLQVALHNDQGQEVAAVSDTQVILLATKHKDVRSARADVEGSSPQYGNSFALPGGSNTARTIVTIARGQSRVGVGFSSQQAGVIRIYAESEKYATGYAIISVLASRAAAARGRELFVRAAYQEEAPAAAGLRIVIEPYNTEYPSIHESTRHWMREFEVMLYDGELPAAAPRQIRVALSGTQGYFLPARETVIPQGRDRAETRIQLLTDSNADIKVIARPVKEAAAAPGAVPVGASAPEIFEFSSAKIATGLVVETSPSVQPASGRDPIHIMVRAVDKGKNTISCKDEGLPKRDIMLMLDGTSYGMKFENGVASLSITADQMGAEHKIFGYGPSGAKVIARAKNKLGQDIVGEGEIEFRFPRAQLVFALLGGACVPVFRRLNSWLRRGQPLRGVLPGLHVEAGLDAMVGFIVYILVFFGAVASTGLNWSGIPVILSALPIQHNPLAAFVLGVLGGAVIGRRLLSQSPLDGKLLPQAPAT